jgi:hypothetical protein
MVATAGCDDDRPRRDDPPSRATALRFRLLGPVTVEPGGERVAREGAKQRALLALLLIRAGEVVSGDRLIEASGPTAARGQSARTRCRRSYRACGAR